MAQETERPGYHLVHIPKGELGELSKVREELSEAEDAEGQNSAIMVLVELSDMYGAMEAYLARHHPTLTMTDLKTFAAITRRAFANGRR